MQSSIIQRGDQLMTAKSQLTAAIASPNALIQNMASEIVDYLGDTGMVEFSDDGKVQILLEAAAQINPAVRDVADTLVATINRVKGD
jgi:hypothetical protein